MKSYDYIILGAGASGLMLAYRMANDEFFNNKSILIIDKASNKGNDRTWCYWEKGQGEWDSILEKRWSSVFFGSKNFNKTIDISPYYYKMIRSEKFYHRLWQNINKAKNIKFLKASVNHFKENEVVTVDTSDGVFTCKQLFNSIPNTSYLKQKKYPVLQQHFLGWFIKTKTNVFDDSAATFMDFSVPQNGNTRFMYVLPLSKNEALFEYTLFSKDVLKTEEYESAIKNYLFGKNITDYEIVEKEKGCIPMTSYKFSKENTSRILNIGTAGGWTKASTGYTFKATTKKTQQLIDLLKTNKDVSKLASPSKFWYYDLLFLDVLANHNNEGSALFTSMFKKANTQTIFRFLDEESTLWEDLKIIMSVPPKRFTHSLIKRLFS
ncbi:lycopene cyclase family protein [Winogradskyella litorisediminis]|uniref:Lycopene cyclase family protein n=1 Tax=Winogradskyella litorisediminis TaxID=1156618 RepID=A0ABW3N9A6_9FLAO